MAALPYGSTLIASCLGARLIRAKAQHDAELTQPSNVMAMYLLADCARWAG